ncbi:hypothetical protein PT974_07107 [Cladobotryum mycophilum]|uniref:Uncharacterized protein n=1 Tax=Cladobotryum mycophilum TaxID=491253 RepID=A0ABR0SNE8_9HYPO
MERCQGGIPCEHCIRSKRQCQQQTRISPDAISFVSFTASDLALQLSQQVQRSSNEIYLECFAAFLDRCRFRRGFISVSQDLVPLIYQSPSLQDIAVAIGALNAGRRGSARSVDEGNSPEYVAFRSYGRSIQALQVQLAAPDVAESEDVLWGTFLLGLFELISEPTGERWPKHMLYGTSKILQLLGPSATYSPLRRRLFEAFRVLEANRMIIYGQDSFLSQKQWMHFQRCEDTAGSGFDALETMLELMIRVSSFSKGFFNIIESVPDTARFFDPSIDALAGEGVDLQHRIQEWQNIIVLGHDNEDVFVQLAKSYYYATLLFLVRNYTYYTCWHGRPIPSLTPDEISQHINDILMLAEGIVKTSDIPGVMLLFPLRMAGAHATEPLQRGKALSVLDQIHQKGFIVSDRIAVDLRELWEYQDMGGRLSER